MVVDEVRFDYVYGDTIKLRPIFDVHIGHTDCDIAGFRRDLEETDNKTLFIGGGDMLDSIITTDKRYRKSSDATTKEAIIDEQTDIAYNILKPYNTQIIGLGIGNHESVIIRKCGTNPIKRLCEKLSTPEHQVKYLGYSCLIKLILSENGGRIRSIVVRQHHGWGGASRTRGANITKYERDIGKWDADIFLYGHVHQLQFDRTPRLGMSGKKLTARPQLMVICGTYQKTYSEDENATFSEEKGFPPVEIGSATIHITPKSHGWVDLSVEL